MSKNHKNRIFFVCFSAILVLFSLSMMNGCEHESAIQSSSASNKMTVELLKPVGDIEQPDYNEFTAKEFEVDTITIEGDYDPAVIHDNNPSNNINKEGSSQYAINDYNSFPWGFNLPFKGCWKMTCGYGCYMHKNQEYYSTDWATSDCNKEVLAPGAGWVLFAGWKNDYGNTVLIEAGPTGLSDGRRYIYRISHLSRIDVVAGWWLPKGWRIGLHGMTGNATGCHIHWTVYRGFYIGYGNVNGWSFPPSFSTGVDNFNGNPGKWCSEF